jgi:hypothetical protein
MSGGNGASKSSVISRALLIEAERAMTAILQDGNQASDRCPAVKYNELFDFRDALQQL